MTAYSMECAEIYAMKPSAGSTTIDATRASEEI
jgi:hypothetical protein